MAHGICQKCRANRRLGFGKSSLFHHLCVRFTCLLFGSELVGFDFARGVGSDAWILTMWLTMWSQASFGFHDRLPNPGTNHAPKVMAINEGY